MGCGPQGCKRVRHTVETGTTIESCRGRKGSGSWPRAGRVGGAGTPGEVRSPPKIALKTGPKEE